MDAGLIPVNDYFNLALLESYVEEYPEDADKWLKFLEEKNKLKVLEVDNIRARAPTNTLETPDIDLEGNVDADIPADYEGVCLRCKRTWSSTAQHPTTTLLCGHKYHTLCWGIYSYENTEDCIFEGCGQNTYNHIREISRRRERNRVDTHTVLATAIINTKAFKTDLKKFKRQIGVVLKVYRKVKAEHKKAKGELLKKHIYSIRQMQNDMNSTVSSLHGTALTRECGNELRAYRRIEKHIYRTYNLSLRDLIRRRVIREMNWNVRSILERHRGFVNKWKFGFRIYPGSKKWTVDDSDHESSNEGSDTEIIEEM